MSLTIVTIVKNRIGWGPVGDKGLYNNYRKGGGSKILQNGLKSKFPPVINLQELPNPSQRWNLKLGVFKDAEKNWKKYSEKFEKIDLFGPLFLENLPISFNF